jgi:hypothetical protein
LLRALYLNDGEQSIPAAFRKSMGLSQKTLSWLLTVWQAGHGINEPLCEPQGSI